MKTPLFYGAPVHAIVFALVLSLLAGLPVRAQLSLQLPISRASHSFSLWEMSPPLTSGEQPIAGWPNLGMPAGYYRVHDVINLGLIGGQFDSAGECGGAVCIGGRGI